MEDYTGGGKKERTVIPFSLHQAKKHQKTYFHNKNTKKKYFGQEKSQWGAKTISNSLVAFID